MNCCTPIQAAKYQHYTTYVQELKQRSGYYWGWIPQEHSTEADANNAFELIRKDEIIGQSVELLTIAAVGTGFKIQTPDWRLSQILSDCVNSIDDFTKSAKNIADSGIMFGMGLQKIDWGVTQFSYLPGVNFRVPVKLREIDRRRIRIERHSMSGDGTPIKAYWTYWHPVYDQYVIIKDEREDPSYPIKIQDFLWYFYEFDELRVGYGQGLGDFLLRAATIRDEILKNYSRLVDKYGLPFAVFYVKNLVGGLSGGYFENISIETHKQNLIDVYKKNLADNVAVIDNNDEVDFKEYGLGANNILHDYLSYIDRIINVRILGAELVTSSGGGTSSYAMSLQHGGMFKSKVHYVQAGLNNTYKRDLVYRILKMNESVFNKIGIKIPSLAQIKFKFSSEQDDIKMDVFKTLTSESEAKKMVTAE